MDDAAIAYDEQGLVPCVIQDWRTGEVLTLAYMNAEALAAHARAPASCTCGAARAASCGTRARRRATPRRCARSATTATATRSLALVEPAGPACHTGERTCFHRGELEPAAPHEVLPGLERTIAARAAAPAEGSYTAQLLADPRARGAKVEEEAEEVARAVREETDERVAEEAADVLYHLAVAAALPRADARRRRRGAACPPPLSPSCGSGCRRAWRRSARSPSGATTSCR